MNIRHIETSLVRSLVNAEQDIVLNVEDAKNLGNFLKNFVKPQDLADKLVLLIDAVKAKENGLDLALTVLRRNFKKLNTQNRQMQEANNQTANDYNFEEALYHPYDVDDYRLGIAFYDLESYARQKNITLPYKTFDCTFAGSISDMNKGNDKYEVSASITRDANMHIHAYNNGFSHGELTLPFNLAREVALQISYEILQQGFTNSDKYDREFADKLIQAVGSTLAAREQVERHSR